MNIAIFQSTTVKENSWKDKGILMKDSVVLILDKMDYKENEKNYLDTLKSKYRYVDIVYTEYEDALIRKVRRIKYIGSVLQHVLYWIKSLNYAKKIMKMNSSDVICINPIVGIFLGMMNKENKFDITMCGFLFEPKNNKAYYEARKKIVNKALRKIKNVVVYANQEVDYYENIFPGLNKFHFVQYGIDYLTENKYSGFLPKSYIFSGGGSNRDYATLFKAYEMVSKERNVEPLVIATLPKCVENLDTSYVSIITDVVLETFGDVEKRSDFVVLSLKDTDISAGHQVMLEALKNNCVVIVNRIKAVEDYVDEKQVLFFESGNVDDLKNKIEFVLEHYKEMKEKFSKNSEYYREHYMFTSLLDRLMKL